MGEVSFYHLTRSPLATALPELLRKTIARGWRALVRGGDIKTMARLDERLWTNDPAGFLAHGLAGGPHDCDQPILLNAAMGRAPNGADVLFVIENAGVEESELVDFKRVCVMFDGNEGGALDLARVQWKTLSASGNAARYWSQEATGWVEKASVNT